MIDGRLVLAPGVVVFPVEQLASSLQAQLGTRGGQYAITKVGGRVPTSLLSAETAELLEQFGEPASLAEAVMAFSAARHADPHVVVDDAFGTVSRLFSAGFLVAADGDHGAPAAAPAEVAGWTVTGVVQRLSDVSVLRARADGGHEVAIKVLHDPHDQAGRDALSREARILELLDGCRVARLVRDGSSEDEPFIAVEWVDGVLVTDYAAARRRPWDHEWRQKALDLVGALLDAYAGVHARGVVHGDVHPKNVIISDAGAVTLVDFGLSRVPSHPQLDHQRRGGVLPFHEPEWARARLAHRAAPSSTAAGDQHALGALLYVLLTGRHFVDPVAEAGVLLERIARDPPAAFSEHGHPPWDSVESVLARMLAKEPADRFGSVEDAARLLRRATDPGRQVAQAVDASPEALLNATIARLSRPGGVLESGLPTAPRVSVNYGAAGVAYFFSRLAVARGDPEHLATARRWLSWAHRQAGDAHAFHAHELGIRAGRVGRVSIYHSLAGVHCVDALVANAAGDLVQAERAVGGFVAESRHPCASSDLTVGRASTVVGATLLWEALQGTGVGERRALLALGDETLVRILDCLPGRIADDDAMQYRGIAHGWAGVLYAALRWCEATSARVPDVVTDRLDELAAAGRGPHDIPMAGWCHGPAGFTHLWAVAARVLDREPNEQRAVRAAEAAWVGRERVPTLCCGLAGQAYAMLIAHRVSGESLWVARAKDLAALAAKEVGTRLCLPNSLWKGDVGIAALACDLDQPRWASMPLFGSEGWPKLESTPAHARDLLSRPAQRQ